MGLELFLMLNNNKNHAWLVVFIPALIYFIVLRTGHHSHTEQQQEASVLNDIFGLKPYVPIGTHVKLVDSKAQEVIGSKLFVSSSSSLSSSSSSSLLLDSDSSGLSLLYPLEVVVDERSNDKDGKRIATTTTTTTTTQFHSTAFVHDAELGRGYVLVSDAHGSGRIWRWEVGGGPITIGKSLHQVQSGCRSAAAFCASVEEGGSRGMAVQWEPGAALSQEAGHLLVVEGGERRIVRIEKDTGSRTPLVLTLPNTNTNTNDRLQRADWLLLTPQGDLLFTASASQTQTAIYRLVAAAHVPPIHPSTSRQAHKWNQTHHSHPLHLLYRDDHATDISGFTIDVTQDLTATTTLYFTTVSTHQVMIQKLILDDDDDDDDNEYHPKPKPFYDMTPFFTTTTLHLGSAITLDKTGTLYATYPGGIAIISNTGQLIAQLTLSSPDIHFHSISLAQDRYIYATTTDGRLARIRTKVEPVHIPTDKYKPLLEPIK